MIPPMSFNYIWVPRFVTSRDANLTYVDRAGYWDPAIAEQLAPYLEFAKSLAPPDASYSHNYDDAWPEGGHGVHSRVDSPRFIRPAVGARSSLHGLHH